MKKILLIVLISQSVFAQTKLLQQMYDGLINNRISINLSLTFDGNLVYGTLIYKKVGQPIKIIGSLQNDEIMLHEFDGKTDITGIYYGTKKGDEISGSWSSPSGKEMKFSVKKTTSNEISKTEITSVTGTYAYSFGKDGGTGNMYVRQAEKDKIILEIQAIKGPPSYNQAIIEKNTLKLVNNEAIYENTEFGKCEFKISFFEGGANIVYVGEAYDCGFGNGASVVGNYLKYDSKAPKFSNNK